MMWPTEARSNEPGRHEMRLEHAVVIAGGGPTGLMLAAELALSRVDVAIARQDRRVMIRTLWIVRTGETIPRFVTCWVL